MNCEYVATRNTSPMHQARSLPHINGRLLLTTHLRYCYAGLSWAGICFLCIVECYFRLPEASVSTDQTSLLSSSHSDCWQKEQKRTYNKLTILFENRVSARKFASTEVGKLRSKSIAAQIGAASDKMSGGDGACCTWTRMV
jgi:hypothetical protein